MPSSFDTYSSCCSAIDKASRDKEREREREREREKEKEKEKEREKEREREREILEIYKPGLVNEQIIKK